MRLLKEYLVNIIVLQLDFVYIHLYLLSRALKYQ